MEVVLIVAIFAVLIFFVATGKLQPNQARAEEAARKSNQKSEGKAAGKIDVAYLIAANERNEVTFEVHYASGGVAAERAAIQSARYNTLKKYEPERVSLKGNFGNDISITYADGHEVRCVCSWMNWEAAEMRNKL